MGPGTGSARSPHSGRARRTAVFRIAAGRHAFEARTLLGEHFAGIVCSDRWRGYDYLEPTQRQLCWAHLLRDFTAHSEGMSEQKAFGQAGLVIAHELFAAWDSYQADSDRVRLQAQTAPLQELSEAQDCRNESLPKQSHASWKGERGHNGDSRRQSGNRKAPFPGPLGADEGTRTLDLLHGKRDVSTDRRAPQSA